jgi:hypothetical protein
MHPAMRTWSVIFLAAALMAPAGVACAAWTVDASGACVEQWVARDVLRGPTAIVNAPLLPFRQLAGGAEYAWNREEWSPWQIAVLGSAATGASGAWGVIESVWWTATGLADTLTGGYFALAPEEATQLSIHPEASRVLTDAGPAPTDQCGRPLK